MKRLILCTMTVAVSCLALRNLYAESPQWRFAPQTLGAALIEGGWMASQTLDNISGSPEFTFPIQLVYLNTRRERGCFSDQWFCPQLESHVLPKGKGVLAWTTLSGGVIGLFVQPNSTLEFADRSGQWVAKLSGIQLEIYNREGWRYRYRAGHLLSIISPTGRELNYEYKGSDFYRIILRDPVSGAARVLAVALGWQSNSRLAQLNISGRIFEFAYGKGRDGRLASLKRPGASKPDIFVYDKIGTLNLIQPSMGESIAFKTEFIDPKTRSPADLQTISKYRLVDDGTFKYTYTGKPSQPPIAGGSITIEDRAGAKQSIIFAERGNIQLFKSADGTETKTVFYRSPGQKYNGKLRRVEQNGKVVSENRYDKETGLLVESHSRSGESTFYEYMAGVSRSSPLFGKPLAVYRGTKDKMEPVAKMKYDAAGRLQEVTDSITKQTTKFNYNSRGELESFIDASGLKTSVRNDAFGRPLEVISGDSKQMVEYDESGNLHKKTSPDGQVTEFVYDSLRRLESVKQNGILIVTYKHDSNGSVTAQTDSLGRTITYEHDLQGRVTAERQPNGSTTRYEFDARGYRTAQIDGNGNRITFSYDPAGHLIGQNNPLGQTLIWSYDDRGKLQSHSNGVQNIAYAYDNEDRLISIDFDAPAQTAPTKTAGYFGDTSPPAEKPRAGENHSNQTITYAYDEKGRVTKIETPTNSVGYFYDSSARLIAIREARGAVERVINYSYNGVGLKTSVELSERVANPTPVKGAQPLYRPIELTNYLYDTLGRLVKIESNGQTVCTYGYDGSNRLTWRQYGNGIKGAYQYDAFGRQTRLELTGGPLGEALTLAYRWDNAGQVTSRTWNGETQLYTYDAGGRLLTVSIADPTKDGIQSAVNSSQSTMSLQQPIESYKYDSAGNMIVKVEGDRTTAMTYNAANELVGSTTDGSSTTFHYDKAGRLTEEASAQGKAIRTYGFLDKVLTVTKSDGERNGFEYWPDGQLAAEYLMPAGAIGQMNVMNEYIWDGLGLIYISGESDVIEPHANGGSCIARIRDGKTSYDINDMLGTTLAVVSDTELKLTPLTAFGRPRSIAPEATAPVPPEVPTVPQQNPNLQQTNKTNKIR